MDQLPEAQYWQRLKLWNMSPPHIFTLKHKDSSHQFTMCCSCISCLSFIYFLQHLLSSWKSFQPVEVPPTNQNKSISSLKCPIQDFNHKPPPPERVTSKKEKVMAPLYLPRIDATHHIPSRPQCRGGEPAPPSTDTQSQTSAAQPPFTPCLPTDSYQRYESNNSQNLFNLGVVQKGQW